MKKIIIFFSLMFFLFGANAQQVEWAKLYPSASDGFLPRHIAAAPNSRIAVAGHFSTYQGPIGTFVHAMDTLGTILWGDTSQMLGASWGNSHCAPGGLAFDKDGNLWTGINFSDSMIIDNALLPANYPDRNFVLTKYNSQGIKDSLRVFSNATLHDLYVDKSNNLYVLLSFKNNIIFFGDTFSASGAWDLLIAKIDSAENLSFSKQLHGVITGIKIKPALQGEIAVLASFSDTLYFDGNNYHGDNEHPTSFILKTNSAGTVPVYEVIPYYSFTSANDLEVNYEGKILATTNHGWTNGSQGFFNVYDTSGNFLVQKMCSGGSYGCDYDFNNMTIADTAGAWCFGLEWNTGNYGIMNDDWTNLAITKLDAQANVIMRDTFPVSWMYYENYKDICADGNQNLYITAALGPGDTVQLGSHTLVNNNQVPSFFVAKINQQPNTSHINSITNANNTIFINPNPSSGIFTIQFNKKIGNGKICVFDVLGNCVLSKNCGNTETETIDLSSKAKGSYFIKVHSNNGNHFKKIIIN